MVITRLSLSSYPSLGIPCTYAPGHMYGVTNRLRMYVSSFARSMPHNPTGRASNVGWIEVQKATAQKYGVHRRTSSMIQLVWRLKVPIDTRHSVQHRARRYRLISKLEFQRFGLTLYAVYDSCVVQFPGTANLRGAKQTGRPIIVCTEGLKRLRYIIPPAHYSVQCRVDKVLAL